MKALEDKKLITAKKREDVELKFQAKKEKKAKKHKSKKDWTSEKKLELTLETFVYKLVL